MTDAAHYARVFFALWPPPAVREQLVEVGKLLHREVGGKPTRPESIHLTLAFLGDVEVERLDALKSAAADVQADACTITIDRAGCWNRNGIGWAGPREMPEELRTLVDRLLQALRDAKFAFDDKPFAAHLTLVRRGAGKRAEPAFDPVVWPVDEFVLVQSELNAGGSRYSIIGRWPLTRT